jgi:hypothetical protein
MDEDQIVSAAQRIMAPLGLHKSTEFMLRFLAREGRFPHAGEWYGPTGRTTAGAIWSALTKKPHPEISGIDQGLNNERVLQVPWKVPAHATEGIHGMVNGYRKKAVEVGLIPAVDALADLADDDE